MNADGNAKNNFETPVQKPKILSLDKSDSEVGEHLVEADDNESHLQLLSLPVIDEVETDECVIPIPSQFRS